MFCFYFKVVIFRSYFKLIESVSPITLQTVLGYSHENALKT